MRTNSHGTAIIPFHLRSNFWNGQIGCSHGNGTIAYQYCFVFRRECYRSVDMLFVNEIFLFVRCTKIWNYADDTTIFACHPTLETIIRQLGKGCTLVAKWFSDNYLKLSDNKCHLIIDIL